MKKVYISIDEKGRKYIENASFVQYRNTMLEDTSSRNLSASRVASQRMKYGGTFKISHEEDTTNSYMTLGS